MWKFFGERSSEYSQVFYTPKSILFESGYGNASAGDIVIRPNRAIYLVSGTGEIDASESHIRNINTDGADGTSATNVTFVNNQVNSSGFTDYYMRYYSNGTTSPGSYTTFLTPSISVSSTNPISIFTIYLVGKGSNPTNYYSSRIDTSGYLSSGDFHFFYDGSTVKSTITEFSRSSGYDYDLIEDGNGFKIEVIADSNGDTTEWSSIIVRSSMIV